MSTAPSPRIPLALQQIFLQSLRGDDVSKIEAPKNGIGFRIFRRVGVGRRKPKQRHVKAPTTSSLHSHRSESSKQTAADASRRAMLNKKTEAQMVRSKKWGESES